MGHWYDHAGNPRHIYRDKWGEEKGTTLAQARKNLWVPSVTGIIDQLDAPGLTNWKLDQMGKAVLKLYDTSWDSPEELIKKSRIEAQQDALKARDRGSQIHSAIESHYKGEEVEAEYLPFVERVVELLDTFFSKDIKWKSETTFSCKDGYGGMCDLHAEGIVIDFKTKDFNKDSKPPKGYENQALQLAANQYGLGYKKSRRLNVFVSRNEPVLVTIYEHVEYDRYIEIFLGLLEIWKLRNKYDSSYE